jgi:hypothetical protein
MVAFFSLSTGPGVLGTACGQSAVRRRQQSTDDYADRVPRTRSIFIPLIDR